MNGNNPVNKEIAHSLHQNIVMFNQILNNYFIFQDKKEKYSGKSFNRDLTKNTLLFRKL